MFRWRVFDRRTLWFDDGASGHTEIIPNVKAPPVGQMYNCLSFINEQLHYSVYMQIRFNWQHQFRNSIVC